VDGLHKAGRLEVGGRWGCKLIKQDGIGKPRPMKVNAQGRRVGEVAAVGEVPWSEFLLVRCRFANMGPKKGEED